MNKYEKTALKKWTLMVLFILGNIDASTGQTAMVNVQARETISLNGEWNAIIDPSGSGDYRQVWLDKKPQLKTDFFEYSFEGGPVLNVPGDFNTQMKELTYYEGMVWYKKPFSYSVRPEKRLFLHFGAVNFLADVYLNGEKIGSHEGGFTPFQFEITEKIKEGENSLIVRVDNRRLPNGLPGVGFDWLNYGGITRDVDLIETDGTFIEDYFIQLKTGSLKTVLGWVRLNGIQAIQEVEIEIPELNLRHIATTDGEGFASIEFDMEPELWSPANPKLYQVIVKSKTDVVIDSIGFRSIEVQGNKVLLNQEPIFLKAVNIHEENPKKRARAFSRNDARILLESAKEMGCNLVRLVHYPHNENMVREAEKMGLMVWNELPVYQHIQFSDSLVPKKMENMLHEMISRDKNRGGVIVWALSNETYPSTAGRDKALVEITKKCKAIDSTRLVVHVTNSQTYKNHTFDIQDTLFLYSDLISINEYIGWYIPWQGKPSETKWNVAFPDKPLFISEFGGEARFGNNDAPQDEAANWTEGYQEQIYLDQIEMFKTIPNLVGVCPWLLYDYKSLGRMHPLHQQGFNRKGLISEDGEKKKAWYVIKAFYSDDQSQKRNNFGSGL